MGRGVDRNLVYYYTNAELFVSLLKNLVYFYLCLSTIPTKVIYLKNKNIIQALKESQNSRKY